MNKRDGWAVGRGALIHKWWQTSGSHSHPSVYPDSPYQTLLHTTQAQSSNSGLFDAVTHPKSQTEIPLPTHNTATYLLLISNQVSFLFEEQNLCLSHSKQNLLFLLAPSMVVLSLSESITQVRW